MGMEEQQIKNMLANIKRDLLAVEHMQSILPSETFSVLYTSYNRIMHQLHAELARIKPESPWRMVRETDGSITRIPSSSPTHFPSDTRTKSDRWDRDEKWGSIWDAATPTHDIAHYHLPSASRIDQRLLHRSVIPGFMGKK